MDFARQQRDPARHMVGIVFVVLLHAAVIWALLNGLGTKVIQVVKKPLTAQIIDTIKPPPPPPPPPPPVPVRCASIVPLVPSVASKVPS